MNLELIALWACVLLVLAGVVLVALDVCALNRSRRRQDAELTQVWAAHARMAEQIALLTEACMRTSVERLLAGTDQLLEDLRAMDARFAEMRDAPGVGRGVRNIEYPEGADPS